MRKTLLASLVIALCGIAGAQHLHAASNDYSLFFAAGKSMSIPHASQINFGNDTDDYSILFWMKTTSGIPGASDTPGVLFSKVSGTSYPISTSVLSSGGKFNAQLWDGSANPSASSTTNVCDGNWHHVAVICNRVSGNGDTLTVMIDGVQQALNTVSINSNVQTGVALTFATGEPWPSLYEWQGYLDEVAIYNAAKSQPEVAALMTAEQSSQSGLVAYYRFENNLVDSSSFDNVPSSNASFSADVPFSSTNQPPTAFALVSPADLLNTSDNRPVFTWQSSTDPEGQPVVYALKISEEASFLEPVYRTVRLVDATSYVPSFGGELANGGYYWKVTASDGEESTTSNQTHQLTISTATPTTPTIAGVVSNAGSGRLSRLVVAADASQGQAVTVYARSGGAGLFLPVSGTVTWNGNSFTFDPDTELDSGAMVYVETGAGGTESRRSLLSFSNLRDVFQDNSMIHGAGPGNSMRLEQDTAYPFKIAANGGSLITVTAWLRRNATYGGAAAPRITLTGLGISGTGSATASMTVGADTWEQLTVIGTPSTAGALTLTVETSSTVDGAAAWIDDISVSQ